MARALNISVQAYSKKEIGKTRITTADLEKIANCLDTPIAIFFSNNLNIKFNDVGG
ncbi:MAG: helix-turn-helix transcriptional regulator [Sporolactobacillus sp.]